MIRLAIDAMGGDHGPSVVIPATLQALKKHKQVHVTLVGNEQLIASLMPKGTMFKYGDRLSIKHTDQQVLMGEPPGNALRNKPRSSMRLAIDLVKDQVADACVSAGNTGALMTIARVVLKTIEGIEKPAIISTIPNINGQCRALDLGANVETSAENLLQFAIMGSVIAEHVDGITNPRVGLLNIGVEEIKGTDQIKQSAKLIRESKLLNYIGFVEGDALFVGDTHVVVCNGFIGNIAIKSGEGLAKLVKGLVSKAIKRNIFTRILGLFAIPIFYFVNKLVHPSRHNGATIAGLNGVVIKSHGAADAFAFEVAINEAINEVEHKIPELITTQASKLL